MDYRDHPLWFDAARSRYARAEQSMALAAAFPNLESEARTDYMRKLVDDINGYKPEMTDKPTPEQEAEWKRNRAELAAMFGRRK